MATRHTWSVAFSLSDLPLSFVEPPSPDLQQHTDSQMRLLSHETELDGMDFLRALPGP